MRSPPAAGMKGRGLRVACSAVTNSATISGRGWSRISRQWDSGSIASRRVRPRSRQRRGRSGCELSPSSRVRSPRSPAATGRTGSSAPPDARQLFGSESRPTCSRAGQVGRNRSANVSQRTPRTAGSSSNQAPTSSPNRAVRRRRTSSPILGWARASGADRSGARLGDLVPGLTTKSVRCLSHSFARMPRSEQVRW